MASSSHQSLRHGVSSGAEMDEWEAWRRQLKIYRDVSDDWDAETSAYWVDKFFVPWVEEHSRKSERHLYVNEIIDALGEEADEVLKHAETFCRLTSTRIRSRRKRRDKRRAGARGEISEPVEEQAQSKGPAQQKSQDEDALVEEACGDLGVSLHDPEDLLVHNNTIYEGLEESWEETIQPDVLEDLLIRSEVIIGHSEETREELEFGNLEESIHEFEDPLHDQNVLHGGLEEKSEEIFHLEDLWIQSEVGHGSIEKTREESIQPRELGHPADDLDCLMTPQRPSPTPSSPSTEKSERAKRRARAKINKAKYVYGMPEMP